MNRESESYFRELPEVHIPRSKIEKPHGLKTTWSVGDCVPIYVDEVLPGTTISMRMSAVMRMATPLYPTLDNLYTDFLWFFVPYRLCWTHWVNMWGENPNAWYPAVEYEVPQIKTSDMYKFKAKTVADYMGMKLETAGLSVSSLPFRAYAKIWTDWFRSDPLQQEAAITYGDTDDYTDPDYAYLGGALLKANKIADMFTSCLPNAQRGPDVELPLGTIAPVYSTTGTVPTKTTFGTNTLYSLRWKNSTSYTWTDGAIYPLGISKTSAQTYPGTYALTPETTDAEVGLIPNNLWTDLTQATAATVSELRSALAVQHFYEQMARFGGGRYTEFLRAIFGVVSPDARLQRSEFLGGKRVPHNIATVVQSSSTDEVSPLGQTGAYSHTADSDDYFTKSFTEAGVIIGIMVTRYKHTYNQGIPKMFLHKKWTDFYLPQFQGISEVPVQLQEIYAQGTADDRTVFGYQEYGYEYRYYPDCVTGEMRVDYAQSLDAWHYADEYTEAPTLGASWIQEDRANVDRTLVVSSGLADQLFGDFYFKPTYVLPMPIYSIPGMQKI